MTAAVLVVLISNEARAGKIEGTLTRTDFDHAGCQIAKMTVGYKFTSQVFTNLEEAEGADAALNGGARWQAAAGTPDDCLAADVEVWVKVRVGSGHKYLLFFTFSLAKSGQESPTAMVPHYPPWDQILCDVGGGKCLSEDETKKAYIAGLQVVSFELVGSGNPGTATVAPEPTSCKREVLGLRKRPDQVELRCEDCSMHTFTVGRNQYGQETYDGVQREEAIRRACDKTPTPTPTPMPTPTPSPRAVPSPNPTGRPSPPGAESTPLPPTGAPKREVYGAIEPDRREGESFMEYSNRKNREANPGLAAAADAMAASDSDAGLYFFAIPIVGALGLIIYGTVDGSPIAQHATSAILGGGSLIGVVAQGLVFATSDSWETGHWRAKNGKFPLEGAAQVLFGPGFVESLGLSFYSSMGYTVGSYEGPMARIPIVEGTREDAVEPFLVEGSEQIIGGRLAARATFIRVSLEGRWQLGGDYSVVDDFSGRGRDGTWEQQGASFSGGIGVQPLHGGLFSPYFEVRGLGFNATEGFGDDCCFEIVSPDEEERPEGPHSTNPLRLAVGHHLSLAPLFAGYDNNWSRSMFIETEVVLNGYDFDQPTFGIYIGFESYMAWFSNAAAPPTGPAPAPPATVLDPPAPMASPSATPTPKPLASPATPEAAPDPVSPLEQGKTAARLAKLRSLYDNGLIDKPSYDRKKAEIIAEWEAQPPDAEPNPGPDLTRLQKLKEIYDQGLIDKKSYDRKRKEIIDAL